MNKNIVKYLIAITLSSACIHVMAEENFELVRVAAPFKTDQHPEIEDPAARDPDDLDLITVNGNKISYNVDQCSYEIESITPFHLTRGLVEIIEDAGGDKKFSQFLNTKLHTDMKQWKTQYMVKWLNKDLDRAGCNLLQHSSIYRSKNEIIITDSTFFYRFVLTNQNFKYNK